MRRSVRVLSAAVLAGGVCAVTPVAAADPAAEVTPASVSPGGTVTVSVTCDPVTGTAPASIEATSLAFAEDTVSLQLVSGAAPVYRGTARIAGAEEFTGLDGTGPDTAWTVDGTCPGASGRGRAWSVTLDVSRAGGGGPGGGSTCTRPPQQSRPDSCPGPAVQHGVKAGAGGTFTDSVPALVAGGLFIAGAFAAAGHRLWRRGTGAGG
ncbi:hypothetical protein IAG44_07290 [Streptomyces roseirectus]|uniref:Secreted protein n=1 Tax=Streptomyces roseirectus TaxID=2768066 RepID=A0A7H0I8Z5_9ACTN|nr:hypothetical protein [Streptomyces roseirectus]QNP69261.1 hypothetical protein IAG44_07290 [Streptomyces roseirectus]